MPSSFANAYCGPPPLPDDLWERWNLDPWVISALLLVLALVWFRPATARDRWVATGAVSILALIFVSPLCALTVALFSARVVHHVLLVALAAPLLAWALWRRSEAMARLLAPLALLHTAIFWLWHAPDAYVWALSSTAGYWLMQVTLLGSAVALWAALFSTSSARAIVTLLFLTVQMGLLGALLVFSAQPLYPPHFATTIAFGLDPLIDQQLAGLIMWVPASLPYLFAALVRLLAVLDPAEEQKA